MLKYVAFAGALVVSQYFARTGEGIRAAAIHGSWSATGRQTAKRVCLQWVGRMGSRRVRDTRS